MTKSDAEKLADEWHQKATAEASRRNTAYDHYGMGWTPESVDPLGAKMAAELRRLVAVEAERDALMAALRGLVDAWDGGELSWFKRAYEAMDAARAAMKGTT